jgi:NitT/TauT family transport system ATP-binding protein
MTPALQFDNITCTFVSKDDRAQRYTAVANTDLSIAPGEFVSVVGPTGCGKSTLLNVGPACCNPPRAASRCSARAQGHQRRAGYMFQAEALMPWRSALQNVIAGLQYRGHDEKAAQNWASNGWRAWACRASATAIRTSSRAACASAWPGADADPGPGHHPHGRTLLGARHPDPPADGKRSAGPVERQEEAVLFITHDLDEAIAMSDRVVVLSAGPARTRSANSGSTCRARAMWPRSACIRFVELHQQIWDVLRDEVLKGYNNKARSVSRTEQIRKRISIMWKLLKPNHKNIRFWQLMVLAVVLLVWHVATRNPQTAFFFGEPLKVAQRIWEWFTVGSGSLEVGVGDTTFFTLSRRDLRTCWSR